MAPTPDTTADFSQAATSTMRSLLDIESSMVLPFSQPSGDNQPCEARADPNWGILRAHPRPIERLAGNRIVA